MTPTLRRRVLAAVVFAACSAFSGSAALADADAPRVLPGPWVRAGRPVVVRAAGAARVRAASGPWALPQGVAGDEFVLQVLRADLGTLEIEVEGLDGTVRRDTVRARVLPADGIVRAMLGAARDEGVWAVDVADAASLPTVPEAWLLFDEVIAAPAHSNVSALPGAVQSALDDWRAVAPLLGRSASGGPVAFEPLLLAPDEQAFRAASEAAAAAPRLPRDVATALALAAAATLLMLVASRGRTGGTGRRRALWVSAPAVVAGAWLVVAAPLPGAVRATAFVVAGDDAAIAVVRFETDVAAEVSFRLPAGASSAAVLAWDAGDATVRDAEAGRSVRIVLPAGAVRLVAWRLPARAVVGDTIPAAPPRAEMSKWLHHLGLEPVAATGGTGVAVASGAEIDVLSARGFRLIPADAIRVSTRK